MKREVVHHLQSSHHQQVWFELCKFGGKILHGGQVRVMVVAVYDISTEHEDIAQLSSKEQNLKGRHRYIYRSTVSGRKLKTFHITTPTINAHCLAKKKKKKVTTR